MKIALINFSGNVGKTTLARSLFAPRIPAKVYAVESINSDGDEENMVRGRDFAELQDEMLIEENLVIDVGASNVEDFLAMMQKFDGANSDIDLFVIPVVPAAKQQVDSLGTVQQLIELGIDKSKLRVLLNQVELQDDYEKTFARVIAFCEKIEVKCCHAVVKQNEIYDLLKKSGYSIDDLLGDETDLKAEMKKTEEREEKLLLARKIAMQRLARGVKIELDDAYKSVVA